MGRPRKEEEIAPRKKIFDPTRDVNVVLAFCKENNMTYGKFQMMETLGILSVDEKQIAKNKTEKFVAVLDQNKFNTYMS